MIPTESPVSGFSSLQLGILTSIYLSFKSHSRFTRFADMTRDNREPMDSTDNAHKGRQTSEQHECTGTSESGDPDLDQARYYARALSRFEALGEKEAQAFAFVEIAGFTCEETAEETEMSLSDVNVYLDCAHVEITTAKKHLEIIEDASCFFEPRNG